MTCEHKTPAKDDAGLEDAGRHVLKKNVARKFKYDICYLDLGQSTASRILEVATYVVNGGYPIVVICRHVQLLQYIAWLPDLHYLNAGSIGDINLGTPVSTD
jgi:hypothetical protein